MYHFNGTNWIKSQLKNSVNQPPLFDIFDDENISFADPQKYSVSSFLGSEIISYKIGTGPIDSELGFALAYLNIDNVGDIQFEYDLESEIFTYKVAQETIFKRLDTGFYKFNPLDTYNNGWIILDKNYTQPIIDTVTISQETNIITSTAVDWENAQTENIRKILFYVNGIKTKRTYIREVDKFTFNTKFSVGDIVTIKIFADLDPNTGYYEVPLGLEKNPLNQKIETFTLGQAADHVLTGIELLDEFTGTYPGNNNLRDIQGYQTLNKRFLKHSNIAPLAMVLLCDKEVNIIKSLQFAKKSYTDFKNTFIDLAYKLFYDQNSNDFVDVILEEISRTQNASRPFAQSDMIGSGAYTSIDYEVEDVGIKTFALSEKFDLDTLSSKAVYLYHNDQQLLHGRDYEFNSIFGFVNLKINLSEGDRIQIREYVSTSSNYIPPTPTKLGLYRKYTPRKFVDDSYVEPKEVIQGHDGSITICYGDFRDDVLLELEFRIYNNIKQEYDESLFDIDRVLGGYYGNSLFGKREVDSIVSPEFLKWIADTNIDYVNNNYLDTENSFTYTYSNMTDPTGTKNLPGYWRGVYKWFYDTDRPHRCPWEMLGFSEQPDWWESEYGPAPYTSNNLLLWEDLRDGIIRQGPRAGTRDRYKRPSLMSHIPVDGDGILLSPLNSGLATNFTLINNSGTFNIGDVSPVEYAWRSSSEWPFALVIALSLLKPFEYITDNFNKSEIVLNKLFQTINKNTSSFSSIEDILFINSDTKIVSGLVSYVVNYLKSKAIPIEKLIEKIYGIDVNLTTRLSGFVDQQQQLYILDSKNPSSTTSSIFVPQENYDIIFNVSSPIYSIAYSGVIIEKTQQGFKINGYDSKDPYFNYYQPVISQTDPLITVGGVSENFLNWDINKFYGNGVIVRFNNNFYRSLKSHESGDEFDSILWKQLPELPVKGAVTAFRRRNFNRLALKRLNYGTLLVKIQDVVDFLLGYQEYLKSIGFVFEGYGESTQSALDWFTSCKEFMFWSKHNWSAGSLLTLSPSAEKIDLIQALGVADNFLDGFYDYQILRDDGTPLQPNFVNVSRDYQRLTVSITNTNTGIFFLRANFVLKEHVTVFDDRTVFNDVIYDKSTGYRQERIKSRGFRTADWDGDYTSPGFLFDAVNIQIWQPFTDYRLGDIVAYKSFYWTSKSNQLGVELFDDNKWTKLDSTPTKGLIANFDYRINQFEDYYEVDADGVGSSQRSLARHVIGYQSREYLQGLAEDEVSQFRLYQGFIREKGTANSIVKVFDKLSRTSDDSVVLNEEWAFKIGDLGGKDQLREIEFEIKKDSLVINPQPVIIVQSQSTAITDQNLRIDSNQFTIRPSVFTTDVNISSIFDSPTRSAGYVHSEDVAFSLKTRDDILNVDISLVNENDHFWITFDKYTWTVLRYNEALSVRIVSVKKEGNDVTITTNRIHGFNVNDIVGITQVFSLTGFYKIKSVSSTTFTVSSTSGDTPAIEDSTSAVVGVFTVARVPTYQDLDYKKTALLANGSRIWVDSNENELWEVVEKIRQYKVFDLSDYGITNPLKTGTSVVYIENLKQIAASLPDSGFVMIYTDRTSVNNSIGLKQIIPAPDGLDSNVLGTFGDVLAVSPDFKWLAIGSPMASAVPSTYLGDLTYRSYLAGEVVLFNGKLWKAKENIPAYDGSSINLDSEFWEPATIVDANIIGRGDGYLNQGMVSLYTQVDGQWVNVINLLSPRQAQNERFGSAITFGVSGNKYYLAISATGSLCDPSIGYSSGKGRVYLYYYNGTTWSHLENTNYSGLYNPGAVFDGVIVNNILTISSVLQGTVEIGMNIYGSGIPVGSRLVRVVNPEAKQYYVDYLDSSSVPPSVVPPLNAPLTTITGIVTYSAESIVWCEGDLYQAKTTTAGDGSSISIDSNDWTKLDPVATQCSLPSSVSIEDDGSTLASGLLNPNQLAELVKDGDNFGHSLVMSRDGSILVVGTPNSDGQFFNNYRGLWNPYQEYRAGDVVKFNGGYHTLLDTDPADDSANTSKGELPDSGLPWNDLGDSSYANSGKIYVYQRINNIYNLVQTITSQNIQDFNESGVITTVDSGDNFGFAIDMDSSATTLVVSSPTADILKQNQGAVFVFKKFENNGQIEFKLTQKLQSYESYTNEYFGSSVSISSATERIVVGAKNSQYNLPTKFDSGTTFDRKRTTFSDPVGFPGQAYVFERKDQGYFLAEKLEADFQNYESFGESVDCTNSVIVVGSPNYQIDGSAAGRVRLFKKTLDNSIEVIRQQKEQIDLSMVKNVELYDNIKNTKIADIDIVDHFKLKILSVAEQDIKYKTIYDPAIYIKGTDAEIVDQSQPWFEDQVGKVWWDLNTVKFKNYEQGDLAYRVGNWNSQATGSTVDIYEWVETPLLPSEWSLVADTVEGLAEGISGQPKYSNDLAYNTKEIFNPNTGQPTGTLYYFWVKNKSVLPYNKDRRVSTSTIASYINNPIGAGLPYISFIDKDKFLLYNFTSILSGDTALINVEYNKSRDNINPVHREYQLLTEGVADNLPAEFLEKKWIDSLVGFDEAGNTVPDDKLSIKQRYGLSFRPRQTMFVDRARALRIVIDNINNILLTKPFADTISFENLNARDPIPGPALNQYDIEVENFIDLQQVGTVKIKQAVLSANFINGEIDTIDIIDPGFGYRTVPFIEIEGTGKGAKAIITLDTQGRVNSVTVTARGKKYTSAIVKIRPFSVLVKNDDSDKNFWSIYGWDQQRKIFYRSKAQGFDTTQYWEYIDWWNTGYDSNSKITKEIISLYEEPSIQIEIGSLLRIKEYSSGGWIVLEKTISGQGRFLSNYNLVGRQNGTIRIKDSLYNAITNPLGYDNLGTYDAVLYDLQPITELRYILKAAKENIFIEDLGTEWNKLFFSSVRYAFSEQQYIDWAFKTSFLNAIHNVGDLDQRPNYKNDNLDQFRNYIEEVKPFRTTIREYTSRYTELENYNSVNTDFDLPPAYSVRDGRIMPVSQFYSRFNEYPWKYWLDNNGYSIISISVSNSGDGYKNPPAVLIEGDGTGARATAFVASGRVSGIRVDDPGKGYTKTPLITLVGGNGTNQNIAKAVAILGESKVRSFDLSIKFDRISKEGIYQSFIKQQTFTATGNSAVFELNYAPTNDKTKIKVIKNGQIVLNDEYEVSLYRVANNGYTLLKGRIRFFTAPKLGDFISITYEKNDDLLDSVNRINKYYAPASGMKGKQINQLMTGIDFGGVQVQGTTFDVTGGWDALPWFTDNWDSVESNLDFYYVADGSTTYVILPYTPEINQPISIYIKRVNESRPVRIDDLYFLNYDGSTPQPNGRVTAPDNALMPTFIGDGSTNIVQLHNPITDQNYVNLASGDTLIFRKLDSDGSVTITDVNLLDTRISGGSLSNMGGAYVNATGLTPEEIVIDGDKFISPDQVPSPEENLPGQVLDSLSIKVFTTTSPGSTPIQARTIVGDGVTKIYDIQLTIVESSSILVYVDKVKQEYIGDSTINYNIDFVNNTIEFNSAPVLGAVIEIIAIGIGGIALLDYQEFVADGETNLFLTKAVYQQTSKVLVTVDGQAMDTGFVNSSDFIDTENRTMIQFGISPEFRQVVKIICFGESSQTDSTGIPFVRINKQTVIYDGSTSSIDLDRFVDLQRGSVIASILVEVNGVLLEGVDTTYVVYDGTNNNIEVGVDPDEAIGTIVSGSIKVYINNVLQRFVIDYTYNGNLNLINLPSANLSIGDIIKIETDTRIQYSIDNFNLVFDLDNITLNEGDVIDITWFGEYPTMDIVSDEYSGGKIQYQLARSPLNANYVWIYKNGIRLTKDRDYSVSLPRAVVYLNDETLLTDQIRIVQFSNIIYQPPRAFEIYKDMLNNYHYKRYSKDNTISLAKDLTYYDVSFEVTDASKLTQPIPERNIPGVVIINNERIEYFSKDGNVLGQLRRGSLGTAIKELHAVQSYVIDIGYRDTLPYLENQERTDFISDGSSLLVGPLDFIPKKSSRSNWQRISIPAEYGPCDEVEVFVGGKRLSKNSLSIFDESIASSSPAADITKEADFSVNGFTQYIRLTDAVAAGTRISIIRKLGKLWYERGEFTASRGVSLLSNNTPIANFIADKPTELPE